MKAGKGNGTLMIILAGVFWGSMGLFVRKLGEYGFTSVQIAAMRLLIAAVCFAVILWFKEPAGFRIRKKDIPLFLGLGLGSILFFTICYFTAIQMMSMSVAAILLYTSPIWVMLMSILFLREKMTVTKGIALFLSFAGCVLVSGFQQGNMTVAGFLIGLGAGVGYGLYSILGTVAMKRYSPYVVTTYTFIIAAAGAIIICQPADIFRKFGGVTNLALLLCFVLITGLVTAVIPFLLYTLGLQSVEAGKAAIFATIEPLVATLLGAVAFSEAVSLEAGIGIVCILAAVILLNRRR